MIRLFSLSLWPLYISTIGVKSRRRRSASKNRDVKNSVARMRAPMTFKFGEVASFVVKDNSYYALPSASTSRKYKGQNVGSMLISPGICR